MKLKRLSFLLAISILLLGACSSTSNPKTEPAEEDDWKNTTATWVEEDTEEDVEEITFAEKRKKIEGLVEAGEISEVENLLEGDSLNIGSDTKEIKSYIDFLKSDEPMSLRTAKLMDSVDYGYSGILYQEIEEAIYSPHEEGSLLADMGRGKFDYMDWKYNENKDRYEEHKHYLNISIQAEIENAVQEHLIEDAKDKNPTLGMTTAEVEASLWGKPEKVNRSVNQYGTREQWVYGQGQYLYFTDGILTSFQD